MQNTLGKQYVHITQLLRVVISITKWKNIDPLRAIYIQICPSVTGKPMKVVFPSFVLDNFLF